MIADTAGKCPRAEHVTADFAYVRLHGSGQPREGRDVTVYFDSDARARTAV